MYANVAYEQNSETFFGTEDFRILNNLRLENMMAFHRTSDMSIQTN